MYMYVWLSIVDMAGASKITLTRERETLPEKALSRAIIMFTASMVDDFTILIAVSRRDNMCIPLMQMLLYDTLA